MADHLLEIMVARSPKGSAKRRAVLCQRATEQAQSLYSSLHQLQEAQRLTRGLSLVILDSDFYHHFFITIFNPMPLSDNVSNQSLKIFLDNYEKYADNLKFEPLIDFIDKDAIYWFTNGTFIGIDAIRKEFERTWSHLKDETYTISDVQWLVETDDYAACIYRFSSNSRVNGKQHTYQGRGTNLFKKVNGNWKIIHEHLSKDK